MKRVFVAATVAAAVLLAACGGGTSTTTGGNPSTGAACNAPSPPSVSLTGAGATFPAPFYTTAFYAYSQCFSQVTVNYQAVGSGAGIQQLTKKTVDFGASDVPMNATELAAAGGADGIVQIAGTLGTEGLAVNLPNVTNGQLKLTSDTIAGIFLRNIKNWNDPALAADNSGLNLPNMPITVVHRSDGSGTTYIFTDYLSSTNAEFKTKIGKGKSVNWPADEQGAKGNEAVASTIRQTPGAIGYVELAYILQTHMTQASLKNHDGNFVIPSKEGATAAASQFPNVSPTNFSIVNAPGANSAPITGFSWVMLYKNQADQTKGTALVDMLYWLVKDGQQYSATVFYAPLPASMVASDVTALKAVTSGGSALLKVSS
jgi:phosphate transport system substrate-binding protein